MKKSFKVIAALTIITLILGMCCIYVSADNTVSDGQPNARYRPILRIEGIANAQNGKYGSMYDISGSVILTENMAYNVNWSGNLSQTSTWQGFDTGTHSNSHTANFQHLHTRDESVIQSYIEMISFNNRENYELQLYYDDTSFRGEYLTLANNYNIGDFIVLGSNDLNAMQEITVKWWQYELNDNPDSPSDTKYVQRSYTRQGTIGNYTGIKEGNRIYLPVFDLAVTECYNALSNNLGNAIKNIGSAPGYLDNATIQLNSIEVELKINNLNHLAFTQVYDYDQNFERPQGDVLIDNRIDYDDISWTDWLTNSVGAIMNFEIVPGLSLAVIFLAVIGVIAVKAFLNALAGG